MSHNTKRANLEFRVTFTETNLLYMLGDIVLDQEKIARCREQLADAKAQLAALPKEEPPYVK